MAASTIALTPVFIGVFLWNAAVGEGYGCAAVIDLAGRLAVRIGGMGLSPFNPSVLRISVLIISMLRYAERINGK
jgi:hypothetical protein